MKQKQKRKKILCKYNEKFGARFTFYRDGTYKTQYFSPGTYEEWILGHCEFGPMFIFKAGNGRWQTRWKSDDIFELKLAETIAKALADLEMEKILKA
jgi:hypothetical protein